jgi:predicted MFS family arabinose efflux permease
LLGRRRTLIIGLSFWVIGEIIQTTSYSFPQFIVGRAIAGFGKLSYIWQDVIPDTKTDAAI